MQKCAPRATLEYGVYLSIERRDVLSRDLYWYQSAFALEQSVGGWYYERCKVVSDSSWTIVYPHNISEQVCVYCCIIIEATVRKGSHTEERT